MPIHLIWGDDAAARDRAIDALIKRVVDPSWSSLNLSRLDGAEAGQALQALEEARTPPFATGERMVLLQRSPFCNGCSAELADRFETALTLVPATSHLVLVNPAKPDGRLRTTKALQKRIKAGQDHEQSFPLPAAWDGNGQRQLVQRTAEALGLTVDADAIDALVDAIGTDSARLESELRKLSLRSTTISGALVQELVGGRSTNALAVGDALLEGDPGEAIARWDALIDAGEPALRIIATLTGQVRGLRWESLQDRQGERDVAVIAKAAGIGNAHRRSPWPAAGTGRHRCPGGRHRHRQRPAGIGTAQAVAAVHNHQCRSRSRAGWRVGDQCPAGGRCPAGGQPRRRHRPLGCPDRSR